MTPRRDTARMKAALLLAAAVAFVMAPFVTPGFQGYPPEAFPVPQVNPPIQPAGYAFSIWGVIYFWILVHAAAGLAARADAPDWDPPRWPLTISLVLGAGWLAVANLDPTMATILIWAMLCAALVALFRTPANDRWLMRAPIALYAGWLTAASFVSLGLMIGGFGLVGSNSAAALLTLPFAIAFAGAVQWRLGRVPEYAIAAGWGLLGITLANIPAAPTVATLAATGALLLALITWRAPHRP